MAAALTLNSAADRWDWTLYAAPLPKEPPAGPPKLELEPFITADTDLSILLKQWPINDHL